jgi:hypothetical protein
MKAKVMFSIIGVAALTLELHLQGRQVRDRRELSLLLLPR